MSTILDRATDALGGIIRRPREKKVLAAEPITELMTLQEAEPLLTGDLQMASFTYLKGEGKANKAKFHFGATNVPASLITRLEAKLKAAPSANPNRLIAQALNKYPSFLDALDAAGISYADAMAQMKAAKGSVPVAPKKTTGSRVPKLERTAELIAKAICKRFKFTTPEKMIADFVALVGKPEFQKEAQDAISAWKRTFKTNKAGFVKTSTRVASENAGKGLAKYRTEQAALKAKKK